jgi:hypothetical protein
LLGTAGIVTGVVLARRSSDIHGTSLAVGVGVGAPVLAAGVVGLIATGISASIHQGKRPESLGVLGGRVRLSYGGGGLMARF